MNVREVTEAELNRTRDRVEAIGHFEYTASFHKNGASTMRVSEAEAKTALLKQAEGIGALFLVFEPHVELPGKSGEERMLILSARAYGYA